MKDWLMKTATKSPSYLVRNEFSYCFRMTIPKDVRRFIGRTELRYSLKTGRVGTAKLKARIIAGQVQLLFQWVRSEAKAMSLSEEKIRGIADRYLKERYQQINDFSPPDFHQFFDRETYHEVLSDLGGMKEGILVDLFAGNYESIGITVRNKLEEYGIRGVKKGSPDWKRLCRDMLRAELKCMDAEIKHLQGDFSYLNELKTPSVDPPRKSTPLLSEFIKSYWADRERAEAWGDRTLVEYRRGWSLLLRIIGNIPIGSITSHEARGFKKTLMRLPANFSIKREYKGLFIQEILKIEHERKLSRKSLNKYIGVVIGIFGFAVKQGLIEKNPFEGLLIAEGRRKKRESELVDAFTSEELVRILNSEEYITDTFVHPSNFWLPLLGLYTGARLEELCQLEVNDLSTLNGFSVLDFNEDGGDKRLKTAASRRIVPLHPFLTKELNFPAYIEMLKAKGESRVFPEQNRTGLRWGHRFSQWFGSYRKKCGVIGDRPRSKVYHSLRHTFINWHKQNDSPTDMVKQIVGHVNHDITTSRYGNDFPKLSCILLHRWPLLLWFQWFVWRHPLNHFEATTSPSIVRKILYVIPNSN